MTTTEKEIQRMIAEKLRDLRRISDYDELLLAVQDLVECVQSIHERVKKIEKGEASDD